MSALFCDFTYSQFRDSAFIDTQGMLGKLVGDVPDNLVNAWRLRVRDHDEVAYDIWVYAYDFGGYVSFPKDGSQPRFIYEAEVFIQRDSEQGPSVNLKYAVKSPKEATETAHAVWQALDCPTHT